MKKELSMIWLKRLYPMHASIWYCTACDLLTGVNASYYNAGVYGWNNDTYLLHTSDGETIAINQGYRNTRGPVIPRDVVEKYNNAAHDIKQAYYNKIGIGAYESMIASLEKLRSDFADEIRALYFAA